MTTLLLVSALAPYMRASCRFEAGPGRAYGLARATAADLSADQVAELLADPYVMVLAGADDPGFQPVADALDLERICQQMAAVEADQAPAAGVTVDAALSAALAGADGQAAPAAIPEPDTTAAVPSVAAPAADGADAIQAAPEPTAGEAASEAPAVTPDNPASAAPAPAAPKPRQPRRK